jgi:RimJ/RimL family protein N-acetyltransferase
MVSDLLAGERVRLTALTKEDLATLARWHHDGELMRMLDSVPANPKGTAIFEESIERQKQAHDTFVFAVRPLAREDLLAWIALDDIEWNHQAADIAILVGREYWGQGYGYEAMTLALNFAFEELNMHRVQLTVFQYNERAIALYEKLGFQKEGVYREFLHRDGKRYDMYLYGLLRSEWELSINKRESREEDSGKGSGRPHVPRR